MVVNARTLLSDVQSRVAGLGSLVGGQGGAALPGGDAQWREMKGQVTSLQTDLKALLDRPQVWRLNYHMFELLLLRSINVYISLY